jgi:hypothetical protein
VYDLGMRLWGAVLVLACACGRIGFSATTDGKTSGDGVTATDGVVPAEACPAFSAFCDGFESGNTNAWSSTTVMAGGSLQVQSSVVHTGHYALESIGQPSTMFYAWAVHTYPNQTSGMLAAREWMYAPQPLLAIDQVLTWDGNSADGNDFISINSATDDFWNMAEGDGVTGTVYGSHKSTTPVALSTWVCVELDIMLATTGSSFALYVGDQQILTASLVTSNPGYDALAAGNAADAGSGGTVYIDDFVTAAQHIGC